jgi:hypothetical protein
MNYPYLYLKISEIFFLLIFILNNLMKILFTFIFIGYDMNQVNDQESFIDSFIVPIWWW